MPEVCLPSSNECNQVVPANYTPLGPSLCLAELRLSSSIPVVVSDIFSSNPASNKAALLRHWYWVSSWGFSTPRGECVVVYFISQLLRLIPYQTSSECRRKAPCGCQWLLVLSCAPVPWPVDSQTKGDDRPEEMQLFLDPTVEISNIGELIKDTHHTEFNAFSFSNLLTHFKKTTSVGI